MMAYRDEISSSLSAAETDQLKLRELRQMLPEASTALLNAATSLQKAREIGARLLQQKMRKELTTVGIIGGKLDVEFSNPIDGIPLAIDRSEVFLGESGPQTVQFLFSANPGERTKPLAQIASGGELSRVMLALKSLIFGSDRVDVLIFDEIDVGIGGEAALLVGQKLRQLASKQQVVVITHLQQIVSFADHHLKAVKREINGRTESELIPLSEEERVVELGRMISGGKFTDVERRQAEKLLAQARAVDN
jgi:DNA repair protein RecN (Recombination protein N)